MRFGVVVMTSAQFDREVRREAARMARDEMAVQIAVLAREDRFLRPAVAAWYGVREGSLRGDMTSTTRHLTAALEAFAEAVQREGVAKMLGEPASVGVPADYA